MNTAERSYPLGKRREGAGSVSEENKALVRRYVEAFNQGDPDALDELLVPDYVDHNIFPDQEPGLEGYKQAVAGFFSAFPDASITVEDMIAEADKVVTRYTFRGTHQGELMGIAPTGTEVTATGIGVHRVAEDMLVEEWGTRDDLGMLQQLGAIPEPGQSEEASPT
jgi:steroid delta-isomerase-like uncharacterized protein